MKKRFLPDRTAATFIGFVAIGVLSTASAVSHLLISAPANHRNPASFSAMEQSGQEPNAVEQRDRDFRLVKLELKGTTVFSEEELLRQSPIKPGDAFDWVKVKTLLDKIRRRYADEGFANCTYNPYIDRDPAQKTMALTFRFFEDLQYFVYRITFAGSSSPTADKSLFKAVSPFLEEGRIYRSRDVDLAIEAINKLGMFKNLTPSDYAVDLKQDPSDPKRGRANITFKLNPKSDSPQQELGRE
jgi:hypothetical protein